MYESINVKSAKSKGLAANFRIIDENRAKFIEKTFPGIPADYILFLKEVGFGDLKEIGEPENYPPHIKFLEFPISAEKQYFSDKRIYDGGAVGDIIIFGIDSTGAAFGFDSGKDYQIFEVDSYRICTPLELKFEYFAKGIFACYPDIPVSFDGKKWKNALGEEFDFD